MNLTQTQINVINKILLKIYECVQNCEPLVLHVKRNFPTLQVDVETSLEAFDDKIRDIFFNAIDHNCNQVVIEFVKHFPNITNERKFRQITPLALVVGSNNIELVKLFLDNDPIFYDSLYTQNNVILRAASCGNIEILNLLMKYGADPLQFEGDTVTTHQMHTLGCGCGACKPSITPLSLNLNSRSPIILHAISGMNIDMIKYVIELGSNVNNYWINGQKRIGAIETLVENKYLQKNKNYNIARYPDILILLLDNGLVVTPEHVQKIISSSIKEKEETLKVIFEKNSELMQHNYIVHFSVENIGILKLLNQSLANDIIYICAFSGTICEENCLSLTYDYDTLSFDPLLISIVNHNNIFAKMLINKYNLELSSTHVKYAVECNNIVFLNMYLNIIEQYLRRSISINYRTVSRDTLFLLASIYVNSSMLSSIAKYNDFTLFEYALKNCTQQIEMRQLVNWDLSYSSVDVSEKIICLLNNGYNFDVMDVDKAMIETNFFECFLGSRQKLHLYTQLMLSGIITFSRTALENYINKQKEKLERNNLHWKIYLPRCPFDESCIEETNALGEYLPTLQNILENFTENICVVCADNNVTPMQKCTNCYERVLCKICSRSTASCPRCDSLNYTTR